MSDITPRPEDHPTHAPTLRHLLEAPVVDPRDDADAFRGASRGERAGVKP